MTGVGHHWTRQADTVVQGVTRSGKSVWTYGGVLAPPLLANTNTHSSASGSKADPAITKRG